MSIKKLLLGYVVLLLANKTATSQTAVFQFLDLSPSARITALGGQQVAIMDNDPNGAAQNPALYNEQMHHQLVVNHQFYVADIQQGAVGFAHRWKASPLTFGGGIQYITYGNFVRTDLYANNIGEFSAGEYAVHLGGSWQHRRWRYGMNMRWIGSQLADYKANGLSTDFGAAYRDSSGRFMAAMVLKHAGMMFKTYADEREQLPTDLQIGVSQRLKYLPFRFSVMAHDLLRWDIRYPRQEPSNTIVLGQEPKEKSYFVDNLFQHLIFSGELYLGKVLTLRAAYNHQRKQAFWVNNRRSMAGFSFGVGIQIKRFGIDYGRAIWHPAGGNHHLGLRVSLD